MRYALLINNNVEVEQRPEQERRRITAGIYELAGERQELRAAGAIEVRPVREGDPIGA